jgi:prenyltransferase beta subunit
MNQSLSASMLAAARRARPHLGGAMEMLARRVQGQLTPEGGFHGRDAVADLYYTVFGIDCLLAAGQPLPPVLRAYLERFGDGDSLDFAHLTCLARCWARVAEGRPSAACRDAMFDRIEAFRTVDGGYRTTAGGDGGSIYGAFLARAAHQDLGLATPDPAGILRCVDGLRLPDGAYANDAERRVPTTNAAVGAVLLQHDLGAPVETDTLDWLLCRRHPEGGFVATPQAAVPDLVSTATAVFALHTVGHGLDRVREATVAYVESLWDEQGGFCAHWLDDVVDCEHTFYALLTLGCLEG